MPSPFAHKPGTALSHLRRERGKASLLIVLSTLALLLSQAQAQELTLHMLDVGYGSCLLLQSKDERHSWIALIDSGPKDALPKIRSKMRELGVRRIDAAFLTHAHPDHSGGYAHWRKPPIQTLYWSGDAAGQTDIARTLERLQKRGTEVRVVRQGMRLSGPGGIEVEVLNPPSIKGSMHENDLVLWVSFGKTAMLLCGDLAPTVQARVIERAQERLQSAGLKFCFANWPHHGDQLDPAWESMMRKVDWIGLSVGPNAYSHSRPERYPSLADQTLRTDRLGTITIISDGASCRRGG